MVNSVWDPPSWFVAKLESTEMDDDDDADDVLLFPLFPVLLSSLAFCLVSLHTDSLFEQHHSQHRSQQDQKRQQQIHPVVPFPLSPLISPVIDSREYFSSLIIIHLLMLTAYVSTAVSARSSFSPPVTNIPHSLVSILHPFSHWLHSANPGEIISGSSSSRSDRLMIMDHSQWETSAAPCDLINLRQNSSFRLELYFPFCFFIDYKITKSPWDLQESCDIVI